jgi:vacuolar-type H+-ATPase subunit F/Vma7
MSRVAVIGEAVHVQGFMLAGALVYPAEDGEQARGAWSSLPSDVAVAILTPRAAAWLAGTGTDHAPDSGVLTVVMPP